MKMRDWETIHSRNGTVSNRMWCMVCVTSNYPEWSWKIISVSWQIYWTIYAHHQQN